MAHHIYHTTGLVLSAHNRGEANQYAYVLTGELGLIAARVQGARAAASKLRPHIQPYTRGDYSFVRGKAGWRLVHACALGRVFENLAHPGARAAFARVAGLLARLAPRDEAHPALALLFEDFERALAPEREATALRACEYIAVARLLAELGYGSTHEAMRRVLGEGAWEAAARSHALRNERIVVSEINAALQASQL